MAVDSGGRWQVVGIVVATVLAAAIPLVYRALTHAPGTWTSGAVRLLLAVGLGSCLLTRIPYIRWIAAAYLLANGVISIAIAYWIGVAFQRGVMPSQGAGFASDTLAILVVVGVTLLACGLILLLSPQVREFLSAPASRA